MNEFELNIGAPINCTDGKCGTLAKVAVSPDTWQITHLIVEEGLLLKRAHAVPFSALSTPQADDGIQLDIESAALHEFPVYRQEDIETTPAGQEPHGAAGGSAFLGDGVPYGPGAPVPMPVTVERVHHGVPTETIVLDGSASVKGYDRPLGKLDRFRVSPDSGAITDLVVQQGLFFTTRRLIPVSIAKAISEDGILLGALEEELEELPVYDPSTHETAAGASQESAVDDGHHVPLASAASGANITTRVGLALFEDSRTSDAVVEVIDDRGIITLVGEVDSPEVRDAAEQIAAAQPGVTSVVNLLRVRP